MKQSIPKTIVAFTFLALWAGIAAATPLGTAFTYQGRLTDSGAAPLFCRMTAWEPFTAPTGCDPKSRLPGLRCTAGNVPVPPSGRLWGLS